MRGARLSILGLYEYDNTIFDGLTLPTLADLPNDPDLYVANPEALDKTDLIANICFELAELPLVYGDADAMKKMIEIWSNISFREWLQLWETLLYKYNPIWNKDGTITESVEGDVTSTNSGNYTDANTGTDTTTNKVTGYDSNTYSPNDQTDLSHGHTLTHTINNIKTVLDDNSVRTRRETGNIGVTMTQEMINRQREVVQFNLYTYITERFKERFCVMVY